jgi:SAM-dependent methyltransferase
MNSEKGTIKTVYNANKRNVTRGNGFLESFLAKKRAKIADKLIPKSSRKGAILDIGCGAFPFFLTNTQFNKKYGIDPNLKSVNRKDGIILIRFDVETNPKLPFNDNTFDVITMLAVFEHIQPKKLDHILSEINRTLRLGGRLIITTPCPWTDSLLRIMAKTGLVSPKEIGDHKGAYNHKDLKKYLMRAGFNKSINLGYFEFFLNNWAYAEK